METKRNRRKTKKKDPIDIAKDIRTTGLALYHDEDKMPPIDN